MIYRYVSLVSLLLSFTNTAQAEVVSNCWDGTYAYKVATLAVDDNYVEIGLKGSLNLIEEVSGRPIIDEGNLPITNPGDRQAEIYLAFMRSECQEAEGTWSCQTTSNNVLGRTNKLFVARYLDDLGQPQYVVSRVSIHAMTANFSPTDVQVSISKRTMSSNVPSVASINFSFHTCDLEGRAGGTTFDTAELPTKLKAYLRTLIPN